MKRHVFHVSHAALKRVAGWYTSAGPVKRVAFDELHLLRLELDRRGFTMVWQPKSGRYHVETSDEAHALWFLHAAGQALKPAAYRRFYAAHRVVEERPRHEAGCELLVATDAALLAGLRCRCRCRGAKP